MPDEDDWPPATVSKPGALAGLVLSDGTALVLSAGLITVSMVPLLLLPLPQAVKVSVKSIAVAVSMFFIPGF